MYDSPQTAEDVFLKKTGRVISMPPTEAMSYGIQHEAEAAKVYEAVTGNALVDEDIGLLVHQTYPDFAASPDRVLKNAPILVEIKCPFKRKIQTNTVPTYYLPQVQIQLEVCDMDLCHFVQYIPPQFDENDTITIKKRGLIDIAVVKRDRDWWQTALPILLRFRDCVHGYYAAVGRPIGSLAPDAKQETKSIFRPMRGGGGGRNYTTKQLVSMEPPGFV